MVMCDNCNNILETRTESVLKFVCGTCGSEYKSQPSDTRIHHESKTAKFTRYKNGSSIFSYSTNPKEMVPCPRCAAKITAYEMSKDGVKKIRGCQCGYTWS